MVITINTREGSEMKQMQIYTEALAPYLELIMTRLKEQEADIRGIASKMKPPYVFVGFDESEEVYQINPIEFALESALLFLKDTIRLDSAEWESTVEEYINIPSRLSGEVTSKQEGMSRYRTRNSTIALCESIGNYIAENSGDVKVPFIFSRWGVSYKVIANLAIIWLGRYLKAQKLSKETITVDETAN